MSYVIDIPNVDIDERIGSAFNDLFGIISATGEHLAEDVMWNMYKVSFLHPFFLAPLAIYRQSVGRRIACLNVSPDMKSYLGTVHFEEPLTLGNAAGELMPFVSKTYLPICRFDLRESDADSLQTVLQHIIMVQSKACEGMTTPLSYFLGELICNMTQHSMGHYGYVFSQYIPWEGCINLVLADDGISVYGSYVRTRKYLDEIGGNEANALRLAYEGRSTKDLPYAENRGYGLSSSGKMLVEGLHGSFFMLSGGAFHRHDVSGAVFVRLPEAINWDGTVILMKIPTATPAGFNYNKYTQ